MNSAFLKIITAPADERKDLFLTASNRLGVPFQNIEKDFWVCLVLDLLFNFTEENEPRLLFKGGTSLSKAYSLISRFSEDIDISVFREDLNQSVSLAELETLSGKQQRKYLENIKTGCADYIATQLKPRLERQFNIMLDGENRDDQIIVFDHNDPSMQTLLVRYPSVDSNNDGYIVPVVKIECGARSALDPHRLTSIQPYIAQEMVGQFDVGNILTIDAERTFWDKVIILHGLRRSFDLKGELRQDGQRFSRHYYDVYQLLQSKISENARLDRGLAEHCVRHTKMFFNSSSLDLNNARHGTFALVPTTKMYDILNRDYIAMREMIFGDVPDFERVIERIRMLQDELNG